MSEITLGDAIRDFVDSRDNPNTANHYKHTLDRLADGLGVKRPVGDITPLDIERYFNAHIKPHNYAPSTWNNHVRGIKVFFGWLVKLSVIDSSPAQHLRRKNDKRLITREAAITDEEIARLIELARARDMAVANALPRALAFVLFCIDSGTRPGEASSLRLSQVDMTPPVANAQVSGKTGERTVHFGISTIIEIRRWLAWRNDRYAQVDDYLWTRDGSPIKGSSLSQLFRRLCLDAGIRSMGIYYARHKKAFDGIDDPEASLTDVASVMGHDVGTLKDHYISYDDQRRRETAKRLFYKPKITRFTPHEDEDIS